LTLEDLLSRSASLTVGQLRQWGVQDLTERKAVLQVLRAVKLALEPSCALKEDKAGGAAENEGPFPRGARKQPACRKDPASLESRPTPALTELFEAWSDAGELAMGAANSLLVEGFAYALLSKDAAETTEEMVAGWAEDGSLMMNLDAGATILTRTARFVAQEGGCTDGGKGPPAGMDLAVLARGLALVCQDPAASEDYFCYLTDGGGGESVESAAVTIVLEGLCRFLGELSTNVAILEAPFREANGVSTSQVREHLAEIRREFSTSEANLAALTEATLRRLYRGREGPYPGPHQQLLHLLQGLSTRVKARERAWHCIDAPAAGQGGGEVEFRELLEQKLDAKVGTRPTKYRPQTQQAGSPMPRGAGENPRGEGRPPVLSVRVFRNDGGQTGRDREGREVGIECAGPTVTALRDAMDKAVGYRAESFYTMGGVPVADYSVGMSHLATELVCGRKEESFVARQALGPPPLPRDAFAAHAASPLGRLAEVWVVA